MRKATLLGLALLLFLTAPAAAVPVHIEFSAVVTSEEWIDDPSGLTRPPHIGSIITGTAEQGLEIGRDPSLRFGIGGDGFGDVSPRVIISEESDGWHIHYLNDPRGSYTMFDISPDGILVEALCCGNGERYGLYRLTARLDSFTATRYPAPEPATAVAAVLGLITLGLISVGREVTGRKPQP